MAPVMLMEAETGERQWADQRRRVLIAAAVAAVVGGPFRILAIDPVEEPSATGWKHCGPIQEPDAPEVLRRHLEIRTHTGRQEDPRETSNHA